MNFALESGEKLQAFVVRFREYCTQVGGSLEGQNVSFPASKKLQQEEGIVCLTEGQLHLCRGEQRLASFEEGEIIDLSWFKDLGFFQLETDFAVLAKSVNLSSSQLNELQKHFSQLLLALFEQLAPKADSFQPRFLSFKEGDQIIEEGSEGTEVYTMIEGEAEVFVGSTRVGQIKENEIFGAIAALTGTKRTASIIAQRPCSVLECSREEFRQLIQTRPQTVESLVQSLAEKLLSSNQRAVDSKR